MITSIVGRLIKKPEPVERVSIPGKRLVNFTVVQNSTHGDRRLSVFINLSMVIATDSQYNLAMRFEKGAVLLFTAPRITYVRQSDRDAPEQSINIYAEVENFRIVAGMDLAPPPGAPPLDGEESAAPVRRPAPSPRQARGPGAGQDDADLPDTDSGDADSGDPFEEAPPPPAPRPPAAKRPAPQIAPQTAPKSAPTRRSAPPPTDDDLAALGDPFAD